jgi:hypothetical protein
MGEINDRLWDFSKSAWGRFFMVNCFVEHLPDLSLSFEASRIKNFFFLVLVLSGVLFRSLLLYLPHS